MSLRVKISLWMTAVTAFFALLTWGALRLVVIPSFAELERDLARQAVTRMTATIAREDGNLRVRCLEWSNWDDTYRFMQTRAPAFIRDNLNDDWFSAFRLNMMAFCDLDGQVVWGEVHSAARGVKLEDVDDAARFLSLDRECLRALARDQRILNGIAMTRYGPMLIAGNSIHRSDRSGVSVGTLIMGSFLSDTELARMAGLEAGAVRAWSLGEALPAELEPLRARLKRTDDIAYANRDSNAQSAFVTLGDTTGAPVLLVELKRSHDITHRGMAACQFALYAVLLVGLLTLLLVVGVLNRSVLGPVLRIIEHVVSIGRTDDLTLRVPGSAPGELGTLLNELNHMLDRLAEDNARRVEAEDRLNQTEGKYRRLFEDSVVGLFQFTPDGRHVNVNHSFARILGYADADEFKQHLTHVTLGLPVHAGQRAELLRRIETEGCVSACEVQLRRKDGSTCWVSLTARVDRDETGQVRFYEGSIEDITERRRVQEELHKLSRAVDQSPASIVITDPEGNIEYVNHKFVEITGYTAAEVLGRKPSILKSGLTSARVYRELWQTIGGGRAWHGELRNRKKNGDLYWEWVSISPLLDADGKVTHFLAVKEDTTRRREADETLRRTLEQVERFNRLAIGRERRIIELKGAVNELLGRLGEPPRYRVGLQPASSGGARAAGVTSG